jgi:hypothetical protein
MIGYSEFCLSHVCTNEVQAFSSILLLPFALYCVHLRFVVSTCVSLRSIAFFYLRTEVYCSTTVKLPVKNTLSSVPLRFSFGSSPCLLRCQPKRNRRTTEHGTDMVGSKQVEDREQIPLFYHLVTIIYTPRRGDCVSKMDCPLACFRISTIAVKHK